MEKLKIVHLYPGEIYHSNKNCMIYTNLGSCVALVFQYKPLNFTAVFHAQFPYPSISSSSSQKIGVFYKEESDKVSFKYLTCAFEYIINLCNKNQIPLNNITVKMYGGSSSFSDSTNSIGKKNIESASNLINIHNLNIISTNVGGSLGRSLYVYTQSGDVYMSFLKYNELESYTSTLEFVYL